MREDNFREPFNFCRHKQNIFDCKLYSVYVAKQAVLNMFNSVLCSIGNSVQFSDFNLPTGRTAIQIAICFSQMIYSELKLFSNFVVVCVFPTVCTYTLNAINLM